MVVVSEDLEERKCSCLDLTLTEDGVVSAWVSACVDVLKAIVIFEDHVMTRQN